MKTKTEPPSFVRGHRGGASLTDTLVAALWPACTLTITELRAAASTALGYDVPSSSIRSTLYTKDKIFERVKEDARTRVAYRLTAWARRQ